MPRSSRLLRSRGLRAVAGGLVLGALVASPVLGYRQGPPADRVGACDPSVSPSCRDIGCHFTYPIDFTELPWSLEQQAGALPAAYVPGRRYDLRLTVDDRAARFASIYGFELAPLVDCPFPVAGGDITPTDTERTRRLEAAGITYLSHRCTCATEDPACCGYRPTIEPNLVDWSFAWDAPQPGAGDVRFDMAFNAANWDGTRDFDRITLGTLTIPEDATCPPPVADLRVAKADCDATGMTSLALSWTASGAPFRVRSTTDLPAASPDRARWTDAGISSCVPIPPEPLVFYSVAEACGSGVEGPH
jgi:hypothetical protein